MQIYIFIFENNIFIDLIRTLLAYKFCWQTLGWEGIQKLLSKGEISLLFTFPVNTSLYDFQFPLTIFLPSLEYFHFRLRVRERHMSLPGIVGLSLEFSHFHFPLNTFTFPWILSISLMTFTFPWWLSHSLDDFHFSVMTFTFPWIQSISFDDFPLMTFTFPR